MGSNKNVTLNDVQCLVIKKMQDIGYLDEDCAPNDDLTERKFVIQEVKFLREYIKVYPHLKMDILVEITQMTNDLLEAEKIGDTWGKKPFAIRGILNDPDLLYVKGGKLCI